MSGLPLNRVQPVVELIVAGGENTWQRFHYEDCFQFPSADRWVKFCGTIPAFAYVIIHETVVRHGPRGIPGHPTVEQQFFFQSIEDCLYALYKTDRADHTVQLKQVVLLESELRSVCKAFKTEPDIYVSLDMILGIILPNRLANYQKDWGSAIFRALSGHQDVIFSDYAAMRLAADLTGIVTPSSLVGHTAADFGIEKYGSASIVLTEFAGSYFDAFP